MPSVISSHFNVVRKRSVLPTVIMAVIGLYLLLAPFLPAVIFKIRQYWGFNTPAYTQSISNSTAPKYNRLIIPAIGLDTAMLEGQDESTVNNGVWHRPQSGDPLTGGNMVLVGHRFRYYGDGSQVFYHLDKVKTGDKITVAWKQKLYTYKVETKKVVEPTETSIEANSLLPKLTIYTCTPIWTNKQRLVLVASPVNYHF